MTVTIDAGRLHSAHVAPLQKQHELIAWVPQRGRAERVRIKEHTCECRATFYELCYAGGLSFIRRTHRDQVSRVLAVHESSWVLTRETADLWLRVLLGSAR